MQAYGRYDFNATADDELSFSKGAVLKILNTDDDLNWCKAELKGKEGYVPRNYIEINPHPWFYGKISRAEAEKILLKQNGNARGSSQPDGAFLVRMCESSPGDFSLSVKYQDHVQHFKILHNGKGEYSLWDIKFNSINELIEHHRTTSVNRERTILLRDMISSTHTEQKSSYADNRSQPQTNQWMASQQQPPISPVSSSENDRMYEAAYDFQPKEEGEIELKRGDRIRMLDQSDIHWWKGEVRGKIGLFPSTYVQPL